MPRGCLLILSLWPQLNCASIGPWQERTAVWLACRETHPNLAESGLESDRWVPGLRNGSCSFPLPSQVLVQSPMFCRANCCTTKVLHEEEAVKLECHAIPQRNRLHTKHRLTNSPSWVKYNCCSVIPSSPVRLKQRSESKRQQTRITENNKGQERPNLRP